MKPSPLQSDAPVKLGTFASGFVVLVAGLYETNEFPSARYSKLPTAVMLPVPVPSGFGIVDQLFEAML